MHGDILWEILVITFVVTLVIIGYICYHNGIIMGIIMVWNLVVVDWLGEYVSVHVSDYMFCTSWNHDEF